MWGQRGTRIDVIDESRTALFLFCLMASLDAERATPRGRGQCIPQLLLFDRQRQVGTAPRLCRRDGGHPGHPWHRDGGRSGGGAPVFVDDAPAIEHGEFLLWIAGWIEPSATPPLAG